MQKISALVCVGVVFMSGECGALRDPFTCNHSHGFVATPQAPVHATQQKASSIPVQTESSEWRIIVQKEDAVVMQHKDGSIREITLNAQ